MTTATLAGKTVTSAKLHIPAFGLSWAEVSLDEEATLLGVVDLKLADLTFRCTPMSGGVGPLGRSSWRLVAGAGGWGRTIPAKSYAIDNGVQAATVLRDAAAACGELFAAYPTDRVGLAFARPEEPASRVLEQLYPSGWYVGEDGQTRIGKRAAAAFAGKADVLSVDRQRGTVSLAAESIAALLPGAIVEGFEAVDVLHELVPGALRSTIWGAGPAATSRRLAAWRRLADQLDPDRKFRGLYEYRIVLQHGERVDLQPVRASAGMPTLQRVRIRPGVPGVRATYQLGSRVVVGFVERIPHVVAFEDADGDGFQPDALFVGESETIATPSPLNTAKRFVRYGDPITFSAPGPGVVAAPAGISGAFGTARSS